MNFRPGSQSKKGMESHSFFLSGEGLTLSKRLGLAGIILLMIAAGIWVVLPKHHGSPGSEASGPLATIPAPEAQVRPAGAPRKPVTMPDPWTRPSAKMAVRNLRRVRFALLRGFGASEKLVNRLTDGDILAVIQELKQQAQRGDAAAANVLEYMAYSTCGFAGINGEGSPSQAQQLLDAQALPVQDNEWIRTAMQEKNDYDKQMVAACQQAIDKKDIEAWVTRSADQGNGASLWLLSRYSSSGSSAFKEQKLMDAADVGYSEAQAFLAQGLMNGTAHLPAGIADHSAGNLLKVAADNLPNAESLLAVCEFKGCPGIEADVPSAVAHAREAAQRGSFGAIIQIGPQLQASLMDPDEVTAWNLAGAMLSQQGCSYGGLSVQWMASATGTLTSNIVSDKAKALAEQYWRDYGAQMMSSIGCGS
jgi:hypothetical protein